jgi:hypothetical protein
VHEGSSSHFHRPLTQKQVSRFIAASQDQITFVVRHGYVGQRSQVPPVAVLRGSGQKSFLDIAAASSEEEAS